MDPDVAEADHPGPVLPSQRGPLGDRHAHLIR